MELARPFARIQISSTNCARVWRSNFANHWKSTQPQKPVSSSSHRLLSCTSRKSFTASQRFSNEGPPLAQDLHDSTSTTPAPTSIASGSKAAAESNQESISKAVDEPPKSRVRRAADDLFGESQQQMSPGAFLTRGVLDNIKSQDERGIRDLESSIKLRLKPSLGRTRAVNTSGGFDLQSAIAAVETSCRQNSVRIDERSQKFHVRRGQRRKELRSLRWRRLFKEGFIKEVGRIQRMRKQGW